MTFDTDEALKLIADFEHFMESHGERGWADTWNVFRKSILVVQDDYAKSVDVFSEFIERLWGGPMGGGLFEFRDSTEWQKQPPEATEEFNRLMSRLSEIRNAALKIKN